MPLDVLGRTRATLMDSTSLLFYSCPWSEGLGNLLNVYRDGARFLQLLISNEEFLVSASHQLALITSLPFVHTARRTYRLNGPVKSSDSAFFVWWMEKVVNWRHSSRKRCSGVETEAPTTALQIMINKPHPRLALLNVLETSFTSSRITSRKHTIDN